MSESNAGGSTTRTRLRLLGVPRLGDSRMPLERGDAAILAMLVLEGPQTRQHLARLLWPDLPAASQRSHLRQRLMRLERRCDEGLFQHDGDLVGLAAGVEHDLQGPPPQPTESTPPLLGTHTYDEQPELQAWVVRARQRMRQRWHADWEDRAEAHEQQQDIAQALPYSLRLAAEEPLQEHAQRRLMRLHHLRRDRGAALAVFADLTQRLRADLGSAPSDETRELAAWIERGAASRLPGPSAVQLAQLRRPERLLQRQAQWQALEQAWVEGRNVLLAGPGGMGKTRLLEDFADAYGIALRLRAPPGASRMPYALLGQVMRECGGRRAATLPDETRSELARIDPGFGAAASGPLLPQRLARAIALLLEGVDALVLDDLHRADDASLELLPLLLTPPRRALLAARPEAMPPALREWVGDPEALLTVPVTPLDQRGIVELLEALAPSLEPAAAWAESLLRHTGGNPYLLLETLRALLSAGAVGAPPRVLPVTLAMQQSVEQRLQALSPQARALARVGALAGGGFDAALAGHVLQQPPATIMDAWRELQVAEIADENGFVHDLMAEAVQAGIATAAAVPLHRRIAEHLEAHGLAPARCADHWAAAGETKRAAESHAAAASIAQRTWRLPEAAQQWSAAAVAFQQSGLSDAAFDAHARQGRLLLRAQDIESAAAVAARLSAEAGNPLQQAEAAELTAHVHLERREADEALLAAERAWASANEAGAPRLQLLAQQRRAAALVQRGQAAEAAAALQGQAEALAPLGNDEQLQWLTELAMALDWADRRFAAIAALERVIALAQSLRQQAAEIDAWSQLAVTLTYAGRLHDSTIAYRRSIALAQTAGLDEQAWLVDQMGLLGHLRDLGQFDEYLPLAEGLPAALRRSGHDFWAANAENDLATTYAMLGRGDLALRTLAAVDAASLPPVMQGARLLVRTRLLRRYAVGKPPRTGLTAWTEQAIRLIGDAGARSYVRLQLALDLAADLPPGEGAERAAAVVDEACHREMPPLVAAARVEQVRLLFAAERYREAAHNADAALDAWASEGPQAGIFVPYFGLVMGRALAEVRSARSRVLLSETSDWIERSAKRLPALFREGFVQRNAIVAALLRLRQRVG